MSLEEYLKEDGTGNFKDFHVPNLIPQGTVRLVLITESPHTYELSQCHKHPLAGASGRDAAEYLGMDGAILGCWVKEQHSQGNSKIALLNVSRVPLQESAFKNTEPPQLDWDTLESLRKSPNTQASCITQPLLESFQNELRKLITDAHTEFFLAGRFAKDFWKPLPDKPEMRDEYFIPHPARNQWKKATEYAASLCELQNAFIRVTT